MDQISRKSVKLFSLRRAIPVWVLAILIAAAGSGAAVGTLLSGEITGEMPMTVSQALLVDGDAFATDDVTFTDGTSLSRSIVATSDSGTGFQVATEMATGDKFLITVPVRNLSHQTMVGLITLESSIPAGLDLDVDEHSVLSITWVTLENAGARGAPLTAGTGHIYNTRYWPIVDNDSDGDVDADDITMTVTGAGSSVTVTSVNALLGQVTYNISGANATSLIIAYRYGSEITILSQTGPNTWKFEADNTVGTNRSGDIQIIVAHPDDYSPDFYRIKGKIEQIGY